LLLEGLARSMTLIMLRMLKSKLRKRTAYMMRSIPKEIVSWVRTGTVVPFTAAT